MNTAAMLAFASAIFCGVMAAAVAWSKPHSLVRLAFVAGMLLLAVDGVMGGLAWRAAAGSATEMVAWERRKLWADGLLPGVWLLFAVCYGRGNYREFLTRWKFFLLAAFLLPLTILLGDSAELIDGQLNLGGVAGFLFFLLLLGGMFLAGINLEKTFRASVGIMRWRIKFMALGLGILFIVRFCTLSEVLLSHHLDFRLQIIDAGAVFVACLFVLRALLRTGHFELDVYPSHALLRNSLTFLLAGIYLVAIGVLAKIVTFFHLGQADVIQSLFFLVAAALLAVLLLSDRVRLRLGQFISRHFQRPLHDYRTVWRRFTEATGACVGQAELCQVAVKAVADTFQALSVSIWLVEESSGQLLLAASTFLSETQANGLRPSQTESAAIWAALRARREPVDIDATAEVWAEHLRRCHPDEFRRGGNRVCVPMVVGDQWVGFLILGDRVSAAQFAWQDFDLLRCIGDHISAGLMNTRLSQKLLQAKEMEAFQTMSAFFVHDLKNTANTLNLMLQNLPVHFDDPAFRADALRGVAKTVAHINHLIGRLGSIRQELQIKPVEADLNEIVSRSMAGWNEVSGVQVRTDFAPLPKLRLDPEQILKVATNLVFNARDAVSPSSGRVQIQTRQQNGWAVLSVSDNGCGMSSEFLGRSLFRPFQTTKKNGLGIGMFQSKMIVEAHRGRIEVDSDKEGTTFRVFLPLGPS